jgi:hypothetical protein
MKIKNSIDYLAKINAEYDDAEAFYSQIEQYIEKSGRRIVDEYADWQTMIEKDPAYKAWSKKLNKGTNHADF